MRILLSVIAISGLLGSAASASLPQYAFAFTVRVDGASPVALAATVSPGTSRMLQATAHLRVEIEAPATTTDASATIVKLIDDSSGTPVVLHTARRAGSPATVRTFSYAVCGGQVTFESPLRDIELTCPR